MYGKKWGCLKFYSQKVHKKEKNIYNWKSLYGRRNELTVEILLRQVKTKGFWKHSHISDELDSLSQYGSGVQSKVKLKKLWEL